MRTVQIPEDVYQQALLLADRDHVSVDRMVAALVRDGVSEWSNLEARAMRGTLTKLESVLNKVGDGSPEPGDEL